MTALTAIAQSGMQGAHLRMTTSAYNIAQRAVEPPQRLEVLVSARAAGGVDSVFQRAEGADPGLERDLVDLLAGKHAFLANLAVFKAGDRMAGTLLDTLS